MNIKKTAAAALLLLSAACAYRLPEPLIVKIFESHALNPQDPVRLLSLMREKGAAGLKEADPYAAIVERPMRVRGPAGDAPLSAGMLLGRCGGGLKVLRVFKGGPAEAAGVRDGDTVLEPAEAQLPAALAEREFALKLSRRGKDGTAQLDVNVRKAQFAFPATFGVYDPGTRTAFVRMGLLMEGGAHGVAEGIAVMQKFGARNVVFDLRGSRGGLPEEAGALLGMFAAKPGTVIMQKARDKAFERSFSTKRRGRYAGLRVAALTDGGTSMAAEAFAASLRELCGARIIGERTAGSVYIQTTFRLTRGRGLRLTVAEFAPASGADLQGKGVAPDENAATPAEASRAWKNGSPTALMDDPAYARAAELFKK